MKRTKLISCMLATVLVAAVMAVPGTAVSAAENEIVRLDGDWHYAQYRTYNRMFQYGASIEVTFEDLKLAAVPTQAAFETFETVEVPYSVADTNGLMYNEESGVDAEEYPLFNRFAEAWFCKAFPLRADFTSDDFVTLHLGTIDDNDMVYINGRFVASSGFKDGNENAEITPLALGGFDYTHQDPAAQVKFAASAYQQERIYKVPTALLNLGGTNTIAVRVYNNNSLGGFYATSPIALCGSEAASRQLQGLPTEAINSPELTAFIEEQNSQLEAGDMQAFAAGISESYNNDGDNKADLLAKTEALLKDYTDISITDTDTAYYKTDDGAYYYEASRTIEGINEDNETVTISSGDIAQYYVDEKTPKGDSFLERGSWNRCFQASYYSEATETQDSIYGVYLPPSYFTNPDRSYPVVYLLHGVNSTSTSFINVDQIAPGMDQWIQDGRIIEMILVMPDSNTSYSGGWATRIAQELPLITEAKFRILGEPEYRGISGISAGGGGAMSIGLDNPQSFSSIASHMGAIGGATTKMDAMSDEELALYDIYLDHGLQDDRVPYTTTLNVHEYLLDRDFLHAYSLRNGFHTSGFYMKGMPYSMMMHSNHFIKNGVLDRMDYKAPVYKAQTLTDLGSGISVSGNILEGGYLNVEKLLPDTERYAALQKIAGKGKDLIDAYTLDLLSSTDSAYEGDLEITISGLQALEGKNLVVVPEEGEAVDCVVTDGQAKLTMALPVSIGITLGESKAEIKTHKAYISGYKDNTVKPRGELTRQEAAAIFYNLLDDERLEEFETGENNFSDVDDKLWSNKAISTLAKAEIISGYKDGSFKPMENISRAELLTMAVNFANVEVKPSDKGGFTDIDDHWAKDSIIFAANNGWVSGYPNGTFLPGNNIVRAETIAIVNNMLGRGCEKASLTDVQKDIAAFTDNDNADEWYYYPIIEATNTHTYVIEDDVEIWTSVS